MCGFCGIAGSPARAKPPMVEAMARTLSHRGPDDAGSWHTRYSAKGRDWSVALGHTRLAILDLSRQGHQPMVSRDGRAVLAYNGEIYNFRTLREELVQHGHQFRTGTDTEVLLEAWLAWGLASLERLEGMFAFALWDESERRLVLARDRLGIKPLVYQNTGDLLLFGSEFHALRAHPDFRADIDRAALGRYLRYGYLSGEETIYRHARRLPPGGYLVWQDGLLYQGQYWKLTPDTPVVLPPQTFDDAVELLEQRLGAAVEARLVSDVPVGAFLSGGVDSSTVVALMTERATHRVRTFSIGFDEPAFNEAPHARAVAQHLGTDHVELYVRRKDAVEVAHELPRLFDEPFADESAIPTLLLSRLTRRHVTVALSGDGGDELFGGYPRHAKLARLAPALRLPPALRKTLARLAPFLPTGSLRNGLRHLAATEPAAVAEHLQAHFTDASLRLAVGEEGAQPPAKFLDLFEKAPTNDLVDRLRYADAGTYLPDDILAKVDRASMSVGLEARVPLLDHQLVRLALSLPRSMIWRDGATKAPLRAMLYRRVPRALIERPKQGFGIPIQALMPDELRRWREHYLSPSRIAEEGLIDPAGATALLKEAQRDEPVATKRLWHLLSFERWYAFAHWGER